ncbi:unnamed protein product [[Candida] boidinii]|uniref:Unnamed protein product n=1 Tax=Candida boidinii TaxID=5477 RepID=A0A9W6T9Y0_CANBO|nr:hypothetical protein B5S30_g4967 [[Candida] boidinii]GME83540.1 unnamed protein product [[Candida] boidinii]GMG21346.1 unnamed protein product [[Candida] boidinii]
MHMSQKDIYYVPNGAKRRTVGSRYDDPIYNPIHNPIHNSIHHISLSASDRDNPNDNINPSVDYENAPHPPVNSQSYLDRIYFKICDFRDNHSQLWFLFCLFSTLLIISFAIFGLVVDGVSLISFSLVNNAIYTVVNFAWYCYSIRDNRAREADE